MANAANAVYGGDLTGGSLLVRESRIVARLMIEGLSGDAAVAKVVDENLFQNNSVATTKKYGRLILLRIQPLTVAQLRLIAEGADDTVRLMLFIAALKAYPLLADFMREVVLDKVKCFEPKLDKMDWSRFLEARESIDPEVGKWTESSRDKMGQVVIRMLAEAGYLDNTRSMNFQFPQVPFDVSDVLVDTGERRLLTLLKLGKGGPR